MQRSPYTDRPRHTFWKSGVVASSPLVNGLYRKRFDIVAEDRIATAGSCFAQHIARNFRKNGFNVVDVEPAPKGLSSDKAKSFGFEMYSARYGNIYTARQLLEVIKESLGMIPPSELVWQRNGRFYDALRPNIEPTGLASEKEVKDHRRSHLSKIKSLFQAHDVFVFTFGLTEAWKYMVGHPRTLPLAPGVIAGHYDPDRYAFHNFSYEEVLADFRKAREILKSFNSNLRFLITVSPVPLAATAMDQHVLQASIYSKSVLRAVCGRLYQEFSDVDYFPSYEIIGTPFVGTDFYEDDLREVRASSVENVMNVFFSEHGVMNVLQPPPAETLINTSQRDNDDIVCEEMLLAAFAEEP